jgi:hypothetical protein
VYHSIAVFITTFLTNFGECPKGEVRRIPIPRTRVNKGKRKNKTARPCRLHTDNLSHILSAPLYRVPEVRLWPAKIR